jgi:hypothetical protein
VGHRAAGGPGRRLRRHWGPDHPDEDIGRDGQGNLWIADIGNNECARTDTALLKVREPDPAAAGPARLLATYRYRFPDPPPGCAGRNAEAMFLVDDAPYLIDKADRSTLYRFPRLDPHATVTLEKVGVLAGQVANLSGADLSSDRRRLAVDSHTMLYVYQTADPSPDGRELVADLISRPPAWTVRSPARPTSRASPSATAATTSTCWPRTATSSSSPPAPTSAEVRPVPAGRGGARGAGSPAGGPATAAGPRRRGRRPVALPEAGRRWTCRPGPRRPGSRPG